MVKLPDVVDGKVTAEQVAAMWEQYAEWCAKQVKRWKRYERVDWTGNRTRTSGKVDAWANARDEALRIVKEFRNGTGQRQANHN
jgi:hypothetical protein